MCRKMIEFLEYIGKDYDGDMFCDECGPLISIKLKEGEVKAFRFKERMEERKWSKRVEQLQDRTARSRLDEKNAKGG